MDESVKTKEVEMLLGNPKKAILAMAVPTVVALTAQAVNNLINAVWVAGLGSDAMAAVGIVFSIYFILIGIGNGIGIGAASLISKYIGNDDKKNADNAASQAVVLIIIIGAVVTPMLLLSLGPILTAISKPSILNECTEYAFPIVLMGIIFFLTGVISSIMRGEGAAKRSMYILIFAAGLNAVLDPFFIYDIGLGWGLAGAAWAVVIAESVALTIMVYWYFVRKNLFLKFRFKGFRFNREIIKKIVHVGLPAASEFFAVSIAVMVVNVILMGTAIHTDAVAIYSSDWRLIQVLVIPLMGISISVVPVCAAAYGARRIDKIREAYFFSLKISAATMLVIASLTAIFAGQITTLFSYGEAEHLRGGLTEFLRIACAFIPFMVFGVVSSSLFQALGLGLRSFVSTVFRNAIIIPAAYFAMTYGSLTTVWWATSAAEITGCVVVGIWCFATLRALTAGRRVGRTEPI